MSQLREAIEKSGGMSAVAGRLGVSAQRLSNWADRGVPTEKCAAVEKVLQPMVTRRDMRPVDWWEIWPELVTENEPERMGECPPSLDRRDPDRKSPYEGNDRRSTVGER